MARRRWTGRTAESRSGARPLSHRFARQCASPSAAIGSGKTNYGCLIWRHSGGNRLLQTSNATSRGSVRPAGPRTTSIWRRAEISEDGKIGFLVRRARWKLGRTTRPPQAALSGTLRVSFHPTTPYRLHASAGEFSQLFVFDMRYAPEQQLTTSPSHKYQASWSPDGRWLAFSANTGGTRYRSGESRLLAGEETTADHRFRAKPVTCSIRPMGGGYTCSRAIRTSSGCRPTADRCSR